MEITVSRQDLVKELTATQSVVERKTTIPILSNFLIEAEEDRLSITATDLDQAIRTSTEVKIKKPGSCTIPARKLYDYIKLHHLYQTVPPKVDKSNKTDLEMVSPRVPVASHR